MGMGPVPASQQGAAERAGWKRGRPRPDGDQRGLRRAGLRGQQGDGLGHQQDQRQRRRDRDRPPDRRLGLPHPGDAAARDAAGATPRRASPRCASAAAWAWRWRSNALNVVQRSQPRRDRHEQATRGHWSPAAWAASARRSRIKMADAGYKVVVTYSPGNTRRTANGSRDMKAQRLRRSRASPCDVADYRLVRARPSPRSQAKVGAGRRAGQQRRHHARHDLQEDGQGQLGRGDARPTSTACST